jgi:hypothetical protein
MERNIPSIHRVPLRPQCVEKETKPYGQIVPAASSRISSVRQRRVGGIQKSFLSRATPQGARTTTRCRSVMVGDIERKPHRRVSTSRRHWPRGS